MFDTKREAAIAFDRAAILRGDARSDLNFPDMDHAKEPVPAKRRTRKVKNATGHKGVSKSGEKFQSKIKVNKKYTYLGQFDTKEAAAIAYDIAALERGDSKLDLNFPNRDYTNEDAGQIKNKMKAVVSNKKLSSQHCAL